MYFLNIELIIFIFFILLIICLLTTIVNIASFCYIIIDLLLTMIFVLLSTELGFRNNLNGALNCLSLSIS